MKNIPNNFIAIILLTLTSACATQTKKEIDSEVRQTPTPKSMVQAIQKFKTSIENSQTLSSQQKLEILELQEKTYIQTKSIKNKIKKLKVVLFENLMSTNYDPKKMDIISAKIKKLNKDKINLMLKSLADAKEILGKNKTNSAFEDIWYFHYAY